jgi:ribonuclease HI
LFDAKPSITPTFGIRIQNLLNSYSLEITPTVPSKQFTEPFWQKPTPPINIELARSETKKETPDAIYIAHYNRIAYDLSDSTHIFTDGSKTDVGVACAFVTPTSSFSYRLPNNSSIFTAELFALLKAVKYITSIRPIKFTIFSDSLSSLQAIAKTNNPNALVSQIQHALNIAHKKDKEISFCWIPGHVGIEGNENADMKAKAAISKQTSVPYILKSDLNSTIIAAIRNKWKEEWQSINNKLSSVKPIVHNWKSSFRRTRKEEVILARVRTGHTRLTHQHLFSRNDPPVCSTCNKNITIKHIFEDCNNLNNLRKKYFSHLTSNGLPLTIKFMLGEHEHFKSDPVFQFLKEASVYNKL